ncbi:ATP-binding cassette domain-containing protein, partial [Mesorhizobium sp.]|uniref:ATP-binding cassette domain-containing protein n=1 Tax=Mesorhizobium sp. TaxID=1871066 RepID=UPI0025BA07AB
RAAEFLEQLEAGIRPDMLVEDLRIGQQQLVEIAKAVSLDARILIMDEPTSALSAAEVEILFKVIADLKARGVAIVYISHRLEELIRIGDYITVLRDGRITGQEEMKNVDTQWIVRQMIGSDAKDFAKADGHQPGEEIFRAEEICLPRVTGGLAVDHVSLSLRAGEILGIYGLMGAGRSELFDCIMGRHGQASGRIFIDGHQVKERDTTRRIQRGLALIPEDRQREGLVSILSVASNLTMASLSRFVSLFHIRGGAERQAVTQMVRELAIKVADPAQEVSSLSGGNQQKVVIGKALLTGPKVLLMDEPSRGIDVGAKADVFRTMRKLSRDGLGILFATSDLDEVMALSDRIAVMSNGKLTGMFDRAEATEAAIVAAWPRTRAWRLPMTDIPAKAAAPSASSGSVLLTLMKLRTFIALIAVLVFFSIAAPNFLSAANLILMAKHVALNAFLAMGMTFVIITGGIDLSVGSIVGLCGMVAGYLVLNGIDLQIGYTVYFNVVEIAFITLAVGILIGAVNGLLITRLNVAPFIATLGTLYVARGFALLSSDGRTFPNLVGKPELGTTGFGY